MTHDVTSPRKVHMSLIIDTDRPIEDVQLAVLAHLSDTFKISWNSIVDLDDHNDTPTITFVVCPVRGLLATFVDNPEAATALAENEGATLVAWTADEDYRNEVTV